MILGVDHIALEVSEFDRALSGLKEMGFDPVFVERDLPNPVAKRAYLSHYQPTHSIALMRKDGCVAVEVTHHGTSQAGDRSAWEAVLRGPSWSAQTASDFAFASDPRLGVRVMKRRTAEEGPLRSVGHVVLRGGNLDHSLRFWCDGMGWRKRTPHLDDMTLLDRPSPVREWSLDLGITEGNSNLSSKLDTAGWSCLAVLTTDIVADLSHLMQTGATGASEPFDMTVGGKQLTVALASGPSGEIVELIQMS